MLRTRGKKRFMDYAIWVDFPVNAGILACIAVWIMQAFQMGIDVALEKDLPSVGNEFVDMMLIYCLPVMVVYIAVAVVVEFIYLILKLCKKEPFITEKYAIGILIGKVIWIAFFVAAALIF